MNCNDCKTQMHNLFDESLDASLTDDLLQHIASCSACSEDYDELKNVLAALHPKTNITAPLLLKQHIIQQLSNEENMKSHTAKRVLFTPLVNRILSVAAIVTAIMFIVPFVSKNNASNNSATAAATVFDNAIDANALIKSMEIKFSIRTDPKDNFDLIGKDFSMVEHTIIKSFGKPEKWRVEKSGRVVLFDGSNQFLWTPELKQAVKGNARAGFIDWLKILLEPSSIMWKEKEQAKEKGSAITMSESEDKTFVTITSKAQGNFLNDYLKNTSIQESDNRREYVFDNKTKLLKGLKIYLLENKTETLIFNIETINYDVTINPAAFAIQLPAGVEWQALNLNVSNETFSNISSKRAAELIFDALAKKDFDSNKEVWSQYNFVSRKMIESNYGGLQVIKIGESFKSGMYPGEFVPYEIKLSNGDTKSFKIALRNDNPNKVWIVDGGL